MNSLFTSVNQNISYGISSNSFFVPALLVGTLSAAVLLISVALKFAFYSKEGKSVVKKCPVSTFSMILALLPIAPLVTKSIGVIKVSFPLNTFMFLIGFFLILMSAIVNILARIVIARFWSDHIVIQEQHEIINTSVFSIVRHPMYSSLIFYITGLSFIFLNYFVLVINVVLFIPMMVFRAAREESLLMESNESYIEYASITPFLVPNPWMMFIKNNRNKRF